MRSNITLREDANVYLLPWFQAAQKYERTVNLYFIGTHSFVYEMLRKLPRQGLLLTDAQRTITGQYQ